MQPKFWQPLVNITSEVFSFNLWEWFLHSSVLEQTKSDLSKINWLRSVILLHFNSVGGLGQVFIVFSYQIFFSLPGSNLNLDCGLLDRVITRFTSVWYLWYLNFTSKSESYLALVVSQGWTVSHHLCCHL
jgi:hypothetical protein